MKPWQIALWIAFCIIPLAATAIAVFAFLPDTVPMHIGPQGIDRYGSKYEAFLVGGLLSACCLLFFLMYVKAEALDRLGLMNGTDVKGGRLALIFAGIVMNVLCFGLLALMIATS